MSIWSTAEPIGYEPLGLAVEGDAAPRFPDHPSRGEVRSYADGWSNHYPTSDGAVEQPAAVCIAHVPSWCVPGHADADDADDFPTGAWLRLDVLSHEHDWGEGGKPTGRIQGVSIVLDPAAARALADDLRAWADAEHLEPR